MQYKIYRYAITTKDEKPVGPDKHFNLFNNSKGADVLGEYTAYRREKNSVLMHIQNYKPNFSGLVGKHATTREVTSYDQKSDVTQVVTVRDDNYPNAAFICFPRLGVMACVEGTEITASSAISRLHAILAHRQGVGFVAEPFTEVVDLRRAVKKFRLVRVDYEILPVNPHTKELGMQLDESRKLDHIKRMFGTLEGTPAKPLALEGGFLTQVQQLQESGHGKVGFTGLDDKNTEIKVPKPREARQLDDDEAVTMPGTTQEVRITLPDVKFTYPFDAGHVRYVREIASWLVKTPDEDE
jgi:hypothetical protein